MEITSQNSPPQDRRPRRRWFRWLLIIVCIPLAAWALPFVILPALHVGRVYRVPTATMSPTMVAGDMVYFNELAYLSSGPARGDIVVFDTDGIRPIGHSEIYVKRVAGLPGDTISISGGKLLVDGRPAPELDGIHYVVAPGGPMVSRAEGSLRNEGDTFTVPAGTYFMLGDNSPNSFDSRSWGPVSAGKIKGRVVFRLWPWSRISWL